MSCSDTKAESKSIEFTFTPQLHRGLLTLSCPFCLYAPVKTFGPLEIHPNHPVAEWIWFLLPLIFNSAHMLTSVGRWSILPVQFWPLHAPLIYALPMQRRGPGCRIVHHMPRWLLCFLVLFWPHLWLILYMLRMSDNDHRISLSIRNSYCN